MREYRFSTLALALGVGLMTFPSWAHAAEAEVVATVVAPEAPVSPPAAFVAEPCAVDNCEAVSSTSSTSEEDEPVVSGGGTVVSKYAFSDLFVQTNSPTAQVWASLDTRIIGINGCSVDLFASRGITTKVGREVDVGASCRFDVAENVNVELSGSRYILGGATDITTLVAKVSHGPVDASVTQYLVDGPEQDATKFEIGYTIEPVENWSLRAVAAYETGFELPDIVTAGAEISYRLNDALSLTFAGYVPLHRGAGDPRSAVATVGVQFSF